MLELLRRNCTTKYFTRSYNCDGSYNTIPGATINQECVATQQVGEFTMVITRTDGCPLGPGDHPEYP